MVQGDGVGATRQTPLGVILSEAKNLKGNRSFESMLCILFLRMTGRGAPMKSDGVG